MSTEEKIAKVATAREQAIKARGGTEYLLAADIVIGTFSECFPWLDAAAQAYAFASEKYAAGDTAWGDVYYALATQWSAIAQLCVQVAHPPTPV
jgi:hypothetical protein